MAKVLEKIEYLTRHYRFCLYHHRGDESFTYYLEKSIGDGEFASTGFTIITDKEINRNNGDVNVSRIETRDKVVDDGDVATVLAKAFVDFCVKECTKIHVIIEGKFFCKHRNERKQIDAMKDAFKNLATSKGFHSLQKIPDADGAFQILIHR
jgi:hypothetical protein